MGDIQDSFEIDDAINKLLIDHIRERPSLHYTDVYTESDEQHWDEIQKDTGIQKSWLKRRWKTIRNDHRKITIYNHMHSKKVPPHKMANHLNFFRVDLNGANNMDFEELKRPIKESICVTQEMLDNYDINESITLDSISIQKLLPVESSTEIQIPTEQTQPLKEMEPIPLKQEYSASDKSTNRETNSTGINTKFVISSPSERCEDTIFGELVVAMLKKMDPDDKKRAKKEIMNILL